MRYNVRQRAEYAMRKGKIKRGICEVCGDPNTHGHHTDYSKVYQLTWLCAKHHLSLHRKMSKGKINKIKKRVEAVTHEEQNLTYQR